MFCNGVVDDADHIFLFGAGEMGLVENLMQTFMQMSVGITSEEKWQRLLFKVLHQFSDEPRWNLDAVSWEVSRYHDRLSSAPPSFQ